MPEKEDAKRIAMPDGFSLEVPRSRLLCPPIAKELQRYKELLYILFLRVYDILYDIDIFPSDVILNQPKPFY